MTKIIGNTIKNAKIGISVPKNSDAEIEQNNMEGVEIGIEERDNMIETIISLSNGLSEESTKQLISELIEMSQSGKARIEEKKERILSKYGSYLGNKSVDLVIQFAAQIAAQAVSRNF